jgi:RimJ/RimL family protein N-acetyltransferase
MLKNIQIENKAKVSMTQNNSQDTVTLKKFTSSNISDFMEWATDAEVTKYMMWNTYNSIHEAEVFFANVVADHPWFKAICFEGKVIGSITLDKGKGNHSCKAELGYVIARKYWGKGVATQAIKMTIQTGFKDLNVERIEAYIDPSNIASQRVLEKNGFEREGILRNFILHKGILSDRYIYASLNLLH